MLLRNKSAVITGGSRGIGKTIAAAYLREGARVLIVAIPEDELRDATKELSSISAEIHSFRADVSSLSDVRVAGGEAKKLFSKVDILVNAAGIYGPIGPSAEVRLGDWIKTYDVNVFGTFRMIQEFLPDMIKEKKGKIINFSGGGDGPFPRFSAYSSSKAAVVRLTETLASECLDYSVDINAITPGPVNTKFLEEALAAGEERVGKERYAAFLKQNKEGGVPPEKAAELCVFLASAASDGLSGKLLSAVWDNWRSWDRSKINEIMKSNIYTLRRVVK